MTAQKLDGRAAAAEIKDELRARVEALKARGVTPGIATVLVGADPGSQLYVGMKHRESEAIGMNSIQRELPADASQADVEALIDELNADTACHGYIVQLPLPKHLDTDAILERIDPAKDADGLHPTNLGRLVLNVNSPITTPLPCTPRGVIELLVRNGYDLAAHTRTADVIVAAAGVPGIIRGDMVKAGAAVLDVGVSRVDGKIAGDVADDVWDVGGWVSPNPGGVGPMTRAMLLSNIVTAAERQVS